MAELRQDAKPLMRVQAAAEELDASPATIYRLIHSGRLPAVRLGGARASLRIPRVELERFVRGGAS